MFFLLLALASSFPARAQSPGTAHIGLSGSLEWERGEINAALSLNLKSAGIALPAGRFRGEEILAREYSPILRSCVLSLQVDSASRIEDYIRRGELDLSALDRVFTEAQKTAPSLSADLAFITGRYTLSLRAISSLLARFRRTMDIPRPLIPSPAADYTGVIIIADGELPIHGKNSSALVRPCLFPKIRDTDTQEIYSRNMLEPPGPGGFSMVRYAVAENIFRPTPSGLEGELAELAGPNPLRIFARGVFGACPTDPIIDKEDALKIISGENNRRLLREGRVVFILNGDVLKRPLAPGGLGE
ncbi:MAG: polymerase [Treponema sp.]|nr:polymerase [Treponema sp.]